MKAQVVEVKGVKMENIDKVIDHGDMISIMVNRADNL